MEEVLKRQLFIRSHTFVTFSTSEKVLAGRMLCGPSLIQ